MTYKYIYFTFKNGPNYRYLTDFEIILLTQAHMA